MNNLGKTLPLFCGWVFLLLVIDVFVTVHTVENYNWMHIWLKFEFEKRSDKCLTGLDDLYDCLYRFCATLWLKFGMKYSLMKPWNMTCTTCYSLWQSHVYAFSHSFPSLILCCSIERLSFQLNYTSSQWSATTNHCFLTFVHLSIHLSVHHSSVLHMFLVWVI